MARRTTRLKVVFLDFDGVLNCTTTIPEFSLDRALVQRLNRLLAQTQAVVVISSTWRLMGLPRCLAALHETGFNGTVIGMTPERERVWGLPSGPRGLEIEDWLDAHPEIETFVILDDDHDMLHLSYALVQTSMRDGLQDHHVKRAIRMLGWARPVR